MLSIIIPTMWRYEPFFEILPTIVDLECVGEIIIINNDVQRTPNLAVLNHPKIVMHNSPENLYVCPAWNLGAKLATNEKMAFLSDDVHINLNVFQKVHDFMTPETGMIGILVDDHEEHSYHRFLKDNTIDIISTRHPVYEERPPPIGFGCLFFINKSDYVDIPKEVKIWHGEVMLWQMMERKKGNHVISNCEAYTPWHATCDSIAQDDGDLYFQIQQNDNYLFNIAQVRM
jgi:hypothetical protein